MLHKSLKSIVYLPQGMNELPHKIASRTAYAAPFADPPPTSLARRMLHALLDDSKYPSAFHVRFKACDAGGVELPTDNFFRARLVMALPVIFGNLW